MKCEKRKERLETVVGCRLPGRNFCVDLFFNPEIKSVRMFGDVDIRI